MSSKMRIPKVCQYCKKEFIAMKLVTKYCSHRCAKLNHKKTKRDEKIELAHQEFIALKQSRTANNSETISPDRKPYLTIKDVCTLLNASETTIRKAIKDKILPTARLGKKHIIRREDIDQLFKTS